MPESYELGRAVCSGEESPSHLKTPSRAHRWCMDLAKQIMKPHVSVSVCLGEGYKFNCPSTKPENVAKCLMEILNILIIERKATENNLISRKIKFGQ